MALANNTPWMGSVTIATGGTAEQLSVMLQALTNFPFDTGVKGRVSGCTIQFPFTESGYLYIGNSWVSSTDRGIELVPSQTYPVPTIGDNPIRLDEIWLVSDHDSAVVNVTLVRDS